MIVNAEKLEELLVRAKGGYAVENQQAHYELQALAPSLACRVIAAEKLVKALEELPLGDGPLAQLVIAYREACK